MDTEETVRRASDKSVLKVDMPKTISVYKEDPIDESEIAQKILKEYQPLGHGTELNQYFINHM